MSTDQNLEISDPLRQAKDLLRHGHAAQAEQCLRSVLHTDPENVEALYRLAVLLRKSENASAEAAGLLEQACSLQPGNAHLHSALAGALLAQQRQLEAFVHSVEAACLVVGNLDLLYNVGLLAAELCCPLLAEGIARRLLLERPDWPAARYLLVRALTALNSATSKELELEYGRLVKTNPLDPAILFARGLQQLRTGNFQAGWEAQEWRWEIEPVKSNRLVSPQPRWTGDDIGGKRLLILGEQGFGDILQFCRYLPLIIATGAHVTLSLSHNRASLARLLMCIEGLEVVIAPDRLPEHDVWCPLASLPLACGTTVDSIPAASYLRPNAADVAAWQERLAGLPQPWIGICWAGSAEHDHNIRRSVPLHENCAYFQDRQLRADGIAAAVARLAHAWNMSELCKRVELDTAFAQLSFRPVLEERGGTFVSLQIGPHADEVMTLPPHLQRRLIAPLSLASNFYETACLVSALDEVVTVDTSVAHLAGSIGKRCTVIKPDAPEWRWLERDGKSVWYPASQLVDFSILQAATVMKCAA